jgi:hypothetical protein
MAYPFRGGRGVGLVLGLCLGLGGTDLLAQTGADAPKADAVAKPKAKAKPKARRGAAKGASKAAGKADAPGGLAFSRDIAPILVANCLGCHGAQNPRKKLEMTSFVKLTTGSENGPVLVAGKPEESELLRRIKGESERGQKMPPGNNRNIAPEAIAKVEAWVKAGARLDGGIDPTAALATYAPTADDLRKAELAKLTPEQRDKQAEAVALERWKKAGGQSTPEMASDKHFVLFSNLPQARAKAVLKALEGQLANVRGLLGTPGAPALDGPEKISVYVFNEPNAYVEFVRALENREVESGATAHGRLDVETPYLAAVDPLAGGDEPAARKGSRAKKSDDSAPTPERGLAGLLVEQLAASATAQAGKAPRWLTLGLGAYFGSLVEPRSPYYNSLREEAFARGRLGWGTKAQEALGGEGEPQAIKAIGFSLFEWMGTTARPALPGFVRTLLEGQDKLDQAIQYGWRADRQAFLQAWGQFVAVRYRRAR